MKKLRTIHLYLGCLFAPLLLFFTVSGIWQTLGYKSGVLAPLSTIHTAQPLKDGSSLSGDLLKVFVVIMGASFVATTILGVVLAIRHGGNRRAAYGCLAFGVACPSVFILLKALGIG